MHYNNRVWIIRLAIAFGEMPWIETVRSRKKLFFIHRNATRSPSQSVDHDGVQTEKHLRGLLAGFGYELIRTIKMH